MTLTNSHELALIDKKKIFHELDVHHVKKVGIKRFCAQEAEMSLTAMSIWQHHDKKIFHELDVHHVKKVGIKSGTFLQSGGPRNESNSDLLALIGGREFFMNERTSCIESRKQTFFGSGGQ